MGTHPTPQQKGEQSKAIKRMLELAGIKDKIIIGYMTRQIERMCLMAFYDGVIAEIENTHTLIAISPKRKGGRK